MRVRGRQDEGNHRVTDNSRITIITIIIESYYYCLISVPVF